MGEETADERDIIDDGRTSQHALVAQVALECQCLLLSRGQPT